MTRADLLIVGISELATPLGDAPRAGADLGRLSILQDAAVACLDDRIVWVGPRSDVYQALQAEGARTLDVAGRHSHNRGRIARGVPLRWSGRRPFESLPCASRKRMAER